MSYFLPHAVPTGSSIAESIAKVKNTYADENKQVVLAANIFDGDVTIEKTMQDLVDLIQDKRNKLLGTTIIDSLPDESIRAAILEAGYYDNTSTIRITYAQLLELIELTSAKLVNTATVLGVRGTAIEEDLTDFISILDRTAVSPVIPFGTEAIGTYLFYGCTDLSEPVLPDSVLGIMVSAFEGCINLSLTTLPNAITAIRESAFKGCVALALTDLPLLLSTVGNSAFEGCVLLTITELPSGLTAIGDSAFKSCIAMEVEELPSGLVSIGSNAFQGCSGITKLWIPATVTTITAALPANSPFLGCPSTIAVYCEAAQKPEGWGAGWDNYTADDKFTPTFGTTLEQFRAL